MKIKTMDSKILLGKILQRFYDKKFCQVDGYKSFGYIRETDNSIYVTREAGQDTIIPFEKILIGIEAYKNNSELFHKGPTTLREFGLTHINSPVWSLLQLLEESDYQ